MKIPTFEEAKQALIEKRGTPLDRFVAYWEPAGNCEEEKFRSMLADVVSHIISREYRPMMVNQNYGTQESLIRSFWNPSTNQYEERK